MSQERFDAVLSRLARELDLDDLPDLIHRGRVNVAGIDVLLGCAPDGSCRLVVDLGPLPEHAGVAVLRRLLELNLRRAHDLQFAVALHPKSSHVVGVAHAAIETLEAEGALLGLLRARVPGWVAQIQAHLRTFDEAGERPAAVDFRVEASA